MVSIKYIDNMVKDLVIKEKSEIEVNMEFFKALQQLIFQSKREVFEDIENLGSFREADCVSTTSILEIKKKHLGETE